MTLKKTSSVDIENYCGTYICYVMMSVYFLCIVIDIGPIHGKF